MANLFPDSSNTIQKIGSRGFTETKNIEEAREKMAETQETIKDIKMNLLLTRSECEG